MFRPSRRVVNKRTILIIQLSITDTLYICSPAPDRRPRSSGMFYPSRRVDNNLIMSKILLVCHSDVVAVGGSAVSASEIRGAMWASRPTRGTEISP